MIASRARRATCPSCRAVFRDGFAWCPMHGEPLRVGGADPLVGTVVASRYRIEALIGEGGVGRVYAAQHLRLSRRFAIKVPFGDLAHDPKMRRRFFREADAAGRLSHRNVVGVVDVGETESGLVYMALDLVEGRSLAQLLEQEGALPAARVASILRQLVDGLAHAHEHGLIHRDLKPENVIVGQGAGGEEIARIIDFGIAIPDDVEERGRLTTEGIIVGTPHYMAPEQAAGGVLDARVDLYALGLILYEMLAGVMPFDGEPFEVLRQRLSGPPPRISDRVRGRQVDPRQEELARWLLEPDPSARPASARAVLAVIDRWPRGTGPVAALSAPPASPVPALPPVAEVLPAPEVDDTIRMRRLARWRAPVAVLIVVAVALAAALAAILR